MWMTGRFLRGDNLSKLQGKTIMLISGCSHQSSCVNVVSTHHVPDPPSGHGAVCARARVPVCACATCSCACVYLEKRIDHVLITPGDWWGVEGCTCVCVKLFSRIRAGGKLGGD